MDRNYGGVVWTNHALQRLKERGLSQGDAWATFRRPDQTRPAHRKGNWVYYKTYGDQKVEVVASKNKEGQWVILSVWSRPVYETSGVRPNTSSQRKWDNLLEKVLRGSLGKLFRR